jgi:hypothetical protein
MRKKCEILFFCIFKITKESDPELDPELDRLVRGTDPGIRIRIRTKMSRILNTDYMNAIIHHSLPALKRELRERERVRERGGTHVEHGTSLLEIG